MDSTAFSGERDKRAFRRTRLRFPVRFRTEDKPSVWQEGETDDVSAAGMLLATEGCVDVSTKVVLFFAIPGERTSREINAVVTRSELDEVHNRRLLGFKFIDLDEADRRHIAGALRNTDIVGLLRAGANSGASDVHLAANHPPLIRVAGKLKALREETIQGMDLKHMIYTLMDERQRSAFERNLELNFSISIAPTVRYRVNVHSQRGNIEAAFRRIEPAVRGSTELNLPPIVERFADLREGLILVTGPTGMGKTTTVSAMINHINSTRAAVVISLEDPIEYVYEYKLSVIKQREIGIDTKSFAIGLREAMRQDPDVIVVGEVRDEETMKTALDAAETGHLVLATFPAANCTDAVLRVIHFFRKERQQEAQLQMANGLRAIISQRLLPRIDVVGVVPATEILVNTTAISNLIRSGIVEQIPSVIQTSSKQGMHSLQSSLQRLSQSDIISLDTVKQHSLKFEDTLGYIEPGKESKKQKRR